MEDEIIKHAKKAYKNMNDPSKSLGHRIIEIVIEVCIIVFAVSLSIWLHQRSEHAKEQAEVREFLLGLKKDLQEASDSTRENIGEFNECTIKFTYLSSLSRTKKPDPDSLNKYFDELHSSPVFLNNESRYEGFKSSGKLEEIENKKLLADILNYYQQIIPLYHGPVGAWHELRRKLNELIIDSLITNEDGTDNRLHVLTIPKAHNLCFTLIPWDQLFERHEAIITNAENIIKEIDEEYK
jgi:hypothetical protein